MYIQRNIQPNLLDSFRIQNKVITPKRNQVLTTSLNIPFLHHRNNSNNQNIFSIFQKKTTQKSVLKQTPLNITTQSTKEFSNSRYGLKGLKSQMKQKDKNYFDYMNTSQQTYFLQRVKLKHPKTLPTICHDKCVYWQFENIIQVYAFAMLDKIFNEKKYLFNEWQNKFLKSKLKFQNYQVSTCNQNVIQFDEVKIKNIFNCFVKALQLSTTKQLVLKYNIQPMLQIFIRSLLFVQDVLDSQSNSELFDLSIPIEQFVVAELFLESNWQSKVQVSQNWYQRQIYAQKIVIGVKDNKGYLKIL